MRYTICDPTGNITALVEDEVEVSCQPAVASEIMALNPQVEQVGFVRLAAGVTGESEQPVVLRMAGGEFCGNATMASAALFAARADTERGSVWVRVCGTQGLLEVRLHAQGSSSFEGSVCMPPARGIDVVTLSFDELSGKLPVVSLEGISHIIIESGSCFATLRDDRPKAEAAIRAWCSELGADGLGLMFVEGNGSSCRLTPLVYIPGADTTFWENSCASGSAATGMYRCWQASLPVTLELEEPGGILRVESDLQQGQTWLSGRVRIL